MISYEQEAAALALGEFADAEKSGDTGVRIDGEIGRKYGINWYSSNYSYAHEALDTTSTLRLVDNVEAGTDIINVTRANTSLKAGDVVATSDNDPSFAVKSIGGDVNSGTYSIMTTGPLAEQISSGHSLKIVPSHNNSIIFHRDAFAFATRPLASMAEGLGNRILSVTDPISGLSLRLEVSRQYKQTVWELDILWGVKMVKPELAVRLISS